MLSSILGVRRLHKKQRLDYHNHLIINWYYLYTDCTRISFFSSYFFISYLL